MTGTVLYEDCNRIIQLTLAPSTMKMMVTKTDWSGHTVADLSVRRLTRPRRSVTGTNNAAITKKISNDFFFATYSIIIVHFFVTWWWSEQKVLMAKNFCHSFFSYSREKRMRAWMTWGHELSMDNYALKLIYLGFCVGEEEKKSWSQSF